MVDDLVAEGFEVLCHQVKFAGVDALALLAVFHVLRFNRVGHDEDPVALPVVAPAGAAPCGACAPVQLPPVHEADSRHLTQIFPVPVQRGQVEPNHRVVRIDASAVALAEQRVARVANHGAGVPRFRPECVAHVPQRPCLGSEPAIQVVFPRIRCLGRCPSLVAVLLLNRSVHGRPSTAGLGLGSLLELRADPCCRRRGRRGRRGLSRP
mmetsp:Transcript_12173/g.30870  ORF Transcript_12173/g.30870 Transcript_12173/m.30870 type:complete len:209 (+) Transcript_12173:709-1335(+)